MNRLFDNSEFDRITREEAAAGHTVVIGRETNTIPCISLWQPWAQWVALGWKTIETRTHSRFASLEGRRIAIHAAQRWDKDAIKIAGPYMRQSWQDRDWSRRLESTTGGIILCTVGVLEHRPLTGDDNAAALIECHITKRFGLILTELKQNTAPFTPIKGKQGIFYIPEALCV